MYRTEAGVLSGQRAIPGKLHLALLVLEQNHEILSCFLDAHVVHFAEGLQRNRPLKEA